MNYIVCELRTDNRLVGYSRLTTSRRSPNPHQTNRRRTTFSL